MGAEPPATEFDPAAVSAALAGTWRYDSPDEPDGVGFLRFADTGRAYSFLLVPSNGPHRAWRASLCPWYIVASPTQLWFHIKPDDEGAPHTYRLEGETLSLTLMSVSHERSWLLHRASADEIPEWFHQRFAAFLAKNP